MLAAGGTEAGAAQGAAVGGENRDSHWRKILKDEISNTNSSSVEQEAEL